MKKFLTILISIVVVIVIVIGAAYLLFKIGPNYIDSSITEEVNITLPKSEQFKVTSTAKGDNQSKIARFNDDVFTFYLDNSGCSDPNARGNDKTMRLIHIQANGEYVVFDSIPVWMHGNVLTDVEHNLVYFTTYEEESEDGAYYNQVKIYTYHFLDGEIERIDEKILSNDKITPFEANPRVGADIDSEGNIAIAFGNYVGMMFVFVYDYSSDNWIKHSIPHYQDTYMNDSNLYPYVRINGINSIRVVASRDTSIDENGQFYPNPVRNYTRYFDFNGTEWNHRIIADLRNKGIDASATPVDIYFDQERISHVITKEDGDIHYYQIDLNGQKAEESLFKERFGKFIEFVRFVTVNDKLYYIVSGDGVKGIKLTGFIEVYDYETNKLVYRNSSICKVPYLYVAKQTNSSYIDMMIISRDKNYKENSDTQYIRLRFGD